MNKIIKPALSVALALSMSFGSVQAFADDSLNSKYFSDVNAQSYGWSASYIDSIAAKGIANGVGNNKFAPGENIKRGDFAIFLDKTFKFDTADGNLINLVDVTEDKYYYQSVVNAKMARAITDVNNYYPENYVTRLDAVKMIYNALTVQNLVGNKASTAVSMYSDYAEIKNVNDTLALGTLTNIGIISGSSDGMFHPNDNLTRAEMAVIFAKTSEYADNTKAEIAQAKEDKKQQAIEEAKANTEETEEKTIVNSGNVSEPMVIDSGKNFKAHDITLDINDQDQDAITIKNGTKVELEDSTIKSSGYTGINLSGNSSLNAENVSVDAKSGVGIEVAKGSSLKGEKVTVSSSNDVTATSFKGNVDIESLNINSTGDGSAITTSNGANISVDGGNITSSNKKVSLINVLSDTDNQDKAELNIKNATLTNKSGSLLKVRDSVISVLLENCNVDVSKILNNEYSSKDKQEEGCDVTITLKNTELTGDIYADHETKVTLDIQEGGFFKGFIDKDMYSEDVNINLTMNGKIELLGDLYVNVIHIEDYNFNNIIDNGFNIYYNDANAENNDLYADTYDLANGGQLLPR
ncbi:MAG: S-layer homology domain-containing protein [Lachnospirales bacterium]